MGISLLSSGKGLLLEHTKADLLRQRAVVEGRIRTLRGQIAGASRELRGLELKRRAGR